MALRKQRKVLCGDQNTDFRSTTKSQPDLPDFGQSRLELISTHKSKKFAEIQKQKMSKTGINPINEQKTFYKSIQKDGIEKIPLFPHQDAQELQEARKEEPKGESHLIYQRKPKFQTIKGVFRSLNKKEEEEKLKQKYLDILRQENQAKEGVKQELIKYKHDQHASAIQETQLVGMQNNQDTLEGKVDLDKVRDIRKAIRRRYANRRNFQKIFTAWDENNTGNIDLKNAYSMIKKMGMNVNIDEARVLLASADEDFDGELNMDEFIQLIFNDNQGLDVDLSKIPVLSKEEINELMSAENVFKGDRNIKQVRHQRQLSLILKNKLASLTSHLAAEDAEKHGFVNIERLQKVLKKLSIPTAILQEEDVNDIFEKYKVGDYKFDYNKFTQDLTNFEFNPEEISKQKKEKEKEDKSQLSYIQKMIQQFRKVEGQEPVHVFDAHKVDSSALERYSSKRFKMQTVLKRYFPKKEDFDEYLQHQLGIYDSNKYKQIQISSSKLTNIIEDIFLNFGEKVPNKDMEGFLSSFVYNQYNQTPCTEVTRSIYEEDAKDWEKKLQSKLKKPPPPQEELFHPDFPKEEQYDEQYYYEQNDDINQQSEQQQNQENSNNLNENNNNNESDLQKSSQQQQEESEQQDNIENKQKKSDDDVEVTNSPTKVSFSVQNLQKKQTKSSFQSNEKLPQFASTSFWRKSGFNSDLEVQTKKVLKKFEDTVFCGTKKAYDVYKQFDADKDGYVSQKDLVKEIQKLDALNHQETKTLLKHLFPDPDKAYLNFQEFSSQLRVGVLDNDNQGKQTVIPYISPSQEIYEDFKVTLPQLREAKQSIRKQFEPDNIDPNQMKNSRFGYSPGIKNTFSSFQSGKQSGMYASTGERFDRSQNHRIQFQVEEKQKKQKIEEAKIQRRQWYSQQITDRYSEMQKQQDNKAVNNRMTKGMCQWTYEHRCHLKNNWE